MTNEERFRQLLGETLPPKKVEDMSTKERSNAGWTAANPDPGASVGTALLRSRAGRSLLRRHDESGLDQRGGSRRCAEVVEGPEADRAATIPAVPGGGTAYTGEKCSTCCSSSGCYCGVPSSRRPMPAGHRSGAGFGILLGGPKVTVMDWLTRTDERGTPRASAGIGAGISLHAGVSKRGHSRR